MAGFLFLFQLSIAESSPFTLISTCPKWEEPIVRCSMLATPLTPPTLTWLRTEVTSSSWPLTSESDLQLTSPHSGSDHDQHSTRRSLWHAFTVYSVRSPLTAQCALGTYWAFNQVFVDYYLLHKNDVLWRAPSVSSLQLILSVCEKELHRLDLMINVKKSLCLRIGPRHNATYMQQYYCERF